MVSFKDVVKDEEILEYIKQSDEVLAALGFTEHGIAHCRLVAELAGQILRDMGYDERECELAQIAGLMHDIGNMVNRKDHAHHGALLARDILIRMNFPPREVAKIVSAIGHHDEETAAVVHPVAAALFLADKSDVRRSRVRDRSGENLYTDIHDRVNYAVRKSGLRVIAEERLIRLSIEIDTKVCPMLEYFEIFLERMILSKKVALYLDHSFELLINNTRLL